MVNNTIYEAMGNGIRKLEGDEKNKRLRGAVAYKWLDVDEESRKRIIFWLDNQVDNGYSTLGFICAGIASVTGFRLIIAVHGEYICSGLVAEALQLGGYMLERGVDPRLETPASLAVRLKPTSISGRESPDWEQIENAAARTITFEVGR